MCVFFGVEGGIHFLALNKSNISTYTSVDGHHVQLGVRRDLVSAAMAAAEPEKGIYKTIIDNVQVSTWFINVYIIYVYVWYII